MTIAELTKATAKMGVRKNNTLAVGPYTLTKWGNDNRWCLTRGEKHISVAGIAHITGILKKNGAVTE